MTLVLNTLESCDCSEQIKALFADKNEEIEIINTADLKIMHCMGCNNCWLKTPGVCAIKDDYEIILKKLVTAENFWVVADTKFGFVDYRGKRVLDRVVPMLNMYIEFRDGWERHQLRYHPLNFGVIYKGYGNRELLEEWSMRVARNMAGRSLGVISLDKNGMEMPSKTAATPVENVALETATTPEHVIIINGSPRVKKNSNTNKIIQAFAEGLEEAGITHKLYSLSNHAEWDEAREAFMTNDNIIIALPLFVECLPSLLLEFLNTLPTERKQPAKLSFILHSGFDEGHQLRLGEKFLKTLPAQLGCSCGGVLVKGGSFLLRNRENSYIKKMTDKMLASYTAMGLSFARNGSFSTPEAQKFTGPEKNPKIGVLLFNLIFKRIVKKNFDRMAQEWGCTRPLNDKPYLAQQR
ncbi:NAD(P)H-dependent oxidoreductase [Fibrobacter sp. UWB11]|uniref:NAD(P)H-dependent oxidoreductase n=1 Tax=Fibrobacter sp. UWB11 TaxID=1896202 RepID=UPI00092A38BE|nr:NAD(P)H-dependent oxidoreductase [Fibrobacter sp. UWB11]SIO28561.1 Multimeric flavodoxin WrbA [Fibrobacter sp. UWB11]